MKSWCILTLFLASTKLGVFGVENIADAESRSIIGGRDAPRHPFYVSLFIRQENSQWGSSCGGTIVTENAVVTAAHCLYHSSLGRWAQLAEIHVSISDFTESSWQSQATTYRVKGGTYSQSYNPRNPGSHSDIALLKIKGQFDMRYNKVLPICGNKRYRKALAIGLGLISQSPDHRPSVLQEAVLFEDRNCQSWGSDTDYRKQVCFSDPGRKSICSGDSGGPLVANSGSRSQCLLGISSFVSGYGCVHRELPGVFTKASYYKNWMESFLN